MSEHAPHPGKSLVSWLLQLSAAAIMLQTLYFKFTAHPESIMIFEALHVEPWGRIASGVVELIAAVLLVIPRPRLIIVGALITLGAMSAAVTAHLGYVGISVGGDGGQLFYLAVGVGIAALGILGLRLREMKHLFRL